LQSFPFKTFDGSPLVGTIDLRTSGFYSSVRSQRRDGWADESDGLENRCASYSRQWIARSERSPLIRGGFSCFREGD